MSKTVLLTAEQEAEESLLTELLGKLGTYFKPEEIDDVMRAYRFGAQAHAGQHRLSGESYIQHPLSVARILVEWRMDCPTIMAAVLHDVMEDTPTAKEQLTQLFGDEVARLVDGVSKLDQINFDSKAEAVAASFRKMILAMVGDIRVIMIKLADRLHNMRTINAVPLQKQRRIARETLEIYVPIAMRLGINSLRVELQDHAFRALYPARYRVLSEQVRKARGNRKEIMDKVEIALGARMEAEGILARIRAREKTLYSIYNKMRKRHVRYQDIMDLFAVRVVVATVDQCYRALGIVHNAYKPIPGLFKDYIAIPKANGYQALHTTLFGPHGIPIEVQLRTEEMDRFAETGIAAHWIYKAGSKPAVVEQSRTHQWLQDLLEIQQKAGNPVEFLENVKTDLFPDEVYVFTPQGAILELPNGATPVDFAYAVHTDVGNHCMAVKIDRRMAPLNTLLHSGQTIEVITSQAARPNPAWLNFVVTAKARTSIRHYLKNLTAEDAVRLGKRLLNQALEAFTLSLEDIPERTLEIILKEYNYPSLDKLLEAIGLGNRIPRLVARRIAPGISNEQPEEGRTDSEISPLAIKGTEGLAVSYGKCCHPIPGDDIVGFISSGRGIVIHRGLCKNIREHRNQLEKWLDVEWASNIDSLYPASVRVDVTTGKRGALASLATTIAESGSNIEHIAYDERNQGTAAVHLVFTVKGRKMLARIMRRIRRHKFVLKVIRTKG